MQTLTEYKCPICYGFLTSTPGHAIDPRDGITLSCREPKCGMADWAHAKNEKDAFEIFKQKCGVTGREK